MLISKRKLITLLLILCIFLMISSASASDSDNDVIAVQNTTDEVMSAEVNENLEISDAGEVLAETDDGSWNALNTKISNAASGDTVFLENDYKFDSTGYGQIIISNPITVDGQGHNIDANGLSRIFVINSNNVILKNIVFSNGYTSDNGGAIRANYDDALNIYNCTFINNNAYWGGAIYSDAYNRMGTISESTFIQNKASYGNAIFNYADAGTIEKCIFIENNGNDDVIYGYGQTVTNSIFLNNDVQIFGRSGTTLGNNWFGNTIENMDTEPNFGSGISDKKYYVLNMNIDKTGTATITLNNLYQNGVLTSDSNCNLPSIKFDVSAVNITVPDNVLLGNDGTATITYTPVDEYSITVKYNGVELTKVVKPNVFSTLKEEINNGGAEIKLDQDYEYDSTKDAALSDGIDFAKDVTIDGDGHIIDAKGLSNIFNFDDTTSSKNLILKNIIFKNAVGENGAVINFKGNKLQVINCSFLDSSASNSLINVESNDESSISDSIFAGNTANYNIVGIGDVVANHNWWGNTLNNYESDISKTNGVIVDNWLFLNITAVTGITGTATVSLNNLYDGSSTGKYNDYALSNIRVNLGGSDAQPKVSFVDIGQTGQATYQFDMSKKTATLTASYNDITASKDLEHVIVDDGSFKALNEIIFFSNENDVIELAHDYIYSATDTITEGIDISKKLTINGNGHKIDAQGKTRIFNILAYANNVELNNISFVNGKHSYASAIYVKYYADYTKIVNCNFTNNIANDYYGAIYVEGDYLTVDGCNFVENTANNYRGGAIFYYHDTSSVIKNCNFTKNKAQYGGAICVRNAAGKVDIFNSNFTDNSATSYGGAIYVTSNGGDLNIFNSNFINNSASNEGGAIFTCSKNPSEIKNSSFIKNKGFWGGAIYNEGQPIDIDKDIFLNNSATQFGAAIYSATNDKINNSIILNNSDLYHSTGIMGNNIILANNWFGNAIEDYLTKPLYSTATTWYYLDVDNSKENSVIINFKLYNSTTQKSIIDENYNLPDIIIKLTQVNLTLAENEIKLNKTGQYKVSYNLNKVKGSITAQCENVQVTKIVGLTDFEKLQKLINDANENDVIELTQDYIYNLEFDTITDGIVINKKNLTIIGNGYTIDAKEKTRIFNVGSTSSDLTLKNITFVNSKHSENGGAINWQASNANLINCTFVNSTSTSNGGAVYFASDNGKIINCSFEKASADKGGFIYITRSNSNVINSTFVNGSASTNGGSIYILGTNCVVFNCTFDTNHAGWGGVIETNKEKTSIANCTFKNNWATSDTRIINDYGGSLTISNSTFIENGRGSNHVLILSNKANFKLINSTFVDNNAGAVQISGSNAKIDKSMFIRNKGVVCTITGTGGNVSNSIFLNNEANCFSGSFTADYNWFGNRIDTNGISTYKNTPNNLGITVNNWLYINATYNPEMLVDSSQPIKVEFKVYANGVISDYDASKVHEVNIKMSCPNGTLDKHEGVVGETFNYAVNKVGTDIITVDVLNNFSVFDKYLHLNVKINKIPTTVTVDETAITQRAHVTVDLYTIEKHTTPEGVHGIFQYSTDNPNILDIVNGYLLSGKKAGTANLIIEFIPDNSLKYESSTTSIEFTITKNNGGAIITDDAVNMNFGDDSREIELSLTPDIVNKYVKLGYISLVYTSNDTDVVTVSFNGVITPVNAGTANITIRFEETEDWEAFEKNVTVTVNKVDSSITFSNNLVFDYLGSDTTTLTLDGCTVDPVNITVISHREAVIEYDSQTNVITISGLDAGTYTLNVTTTPDRNHNSVSNNAIITVNKIDSSMTLSNTDIEFNYSSSNSTVLTLVGCSVDAENIMVLDSNSNIVENAFTYEDNVITLSGLDAGTYTLKITPAINSNYNPVSAVEIPVKVNKIDSSFELSKAIEFNYLESDTTNIINLDGGIVDLENITVLDTNLVKVAAAIRLEGDVITLSDLAAGSYTLKVVTTPDENHNSVEKTVSVKVNKIPSTIVLSNNNILFDYGKSNTTALTLNGCSVDLENITILDSENTPVVGDIEINNNVITVSGLDAGTYTLKIKTTPDENHTSVDTTADITVNKVNSTVRFSNPVNLFFSETGTTTLILDGCSVVLDDISIADHPEAGIAFENNVITISDLAEGNYTLKVITTPDRNHFSVENTTSVNVYKVGPKMEMDYSNITVGESEKVFITFATDATGTVNVTVSQGSSVIRTQNLSMTVGFNRTVFAGLKVGIYNITAHYYGHGRYNASTLVYRLIVHPIYEYDFSATANDTVMGNKTNVTVILPEGASGKIVIGDIETPVSGTKTVIELPAQNTLGKNNATVKYVPDEDSKYSSRELTVLYDVSKVETEIALEIINATTADPVTITANINAEGNVTFTVNGKKYSREISDNKAVLELNDVAGGKYNVTAVYDGNSKYANSSANDTFTVSKLNSTISISLTPDSINADGESTLTVNVRGNGTVTVSVNGIPVNITADEGVATLTLKDLPKGTNTISAKYLGDDRYNGNETDEITLAVEGADYEITLDIANITVGEDAIAYITVPNDAMANINITLSNGSVIRTENFTGFKYVIPISLAVGSYNITAKYTGDNKYDAKEITKEFSVKSLNVGKLNFTVNVNDTFVGKTTNVTVSLPSDATGKIVIGETEYNIGDEIILPVQRTAGLNNITVKYIPDANSKYGSDNVTAYYNVAKNAAEIIIIPLDDIKAGQSITISASSKSNGNIIISVDGVKTSTVNDISAGKHTVIASVAETDEYLAAAANYTFTVTKSDSLIKQITSDAVTEGQKTLINISMNSSESGNVIIEINGVNYTSKIINGNTSFEIELNETTAGKVYYLGDEKYNKAEAKEFTAVVNPKADSVIVINDPVLNIGESAAFTASVNDDVADLTITVNGAETSVISKVEAVTYTVTAVFAGNATHKANSTTRTFTVEKSEVSVNVTATDTKVGEKTTVTVNITDGATGIVVIDVNGTEYSINITETRTLSVVMSEKGTATVTAKYLGDEKYAQKESESATFEVSEKTSPVVELNVPEDIKVGDEVSIPIMEGADVYIDGVKQKVKNGKVTLPTTVGTHTILAVVNETPETSKAENVTSYSVSKKSSEITISTSVITIGQNMTVVVNTHGRDGASVSVDGNSVELTDSSFQFFATAGNHTVVAVLDENDEYLSAYANYTFKVNKKDAKINILTSAQSVYAGQSVNIDVEIMEATGIVVIDVNGTQYSLNLSQTHFLDVVLPETGIYNITAKYLGDDIFNPAENSTAVEACEKMVSPITAEIPDSPKAKETLIINVTCEDGSEVLLDGVKVTMTDGKVTLPEISYGNHVLEVITPESSTHRANSTKISFTVDKKESSINITGIQGDLIVDKFNKLNIEYTGNEIIVYIDGEKVTNYKQFKVDAGKHSVVASVVEDDEYVSSSDTYNFTIAKNTVNINVGGSHATVGEEIPITVDISDEATGLVIINVNGTEHLLNISESKTLNIVLNTPGRYEVSAKYLGDDNYAEKESESSYFMVNDKKNSAIEVEIPENITPGESVTFNVTSDNNNLEVLFDGVKQNISDGKITLENITSGTHTVEVIADETSEFKANRTSKTFTADKKASDVIITVPEDIELGDDVEITVTSYEGADIRVYVDGVKVNLTDGKVTVKATLGNHTVTAKIDETEVYLKAEDAKTFAVDKFQSQITVSAVNITEGKKTTVTVDTPLNEGIVKINVDENEVLIDLSKTKTAEIQLNTPGDYEVTATYIANDRYKESSSKTDVNVASKDTPQITLTASGDVEKSLVKVKMPADAKGNVTLAVDGKKVATQTLSNGLATFELENMTSGNHNISVSYSGDDNYYSGVKNTTMDVSKIKTGKMDVNIENPQNSTTLKVEVELPGDAEGTVNVSVDGDKTYTAEIKNGKASITTDELTPGDYNITVSYSGDDKYENASSNTTGSVSKLNPEMTVKTDSSKDSTLTVDVELPGDAEGTVNVCVDGDKTYTAEVKNGKASLTVDNLANGTHDVSVTYSGDGKYSNKTSLQTADVTSKVKDYDINATCENAVEGKTKIVINTPDDADGGVEVKIGNKTYAASVKNGKAEIDAGDLAAGNYTAEIIYSGNAKYADKTLTEDINVKEKTKTISASNMKRGQASPYDYQAKFFDKNGNPLKNKKVQFKVNGKTYTVKTDSKGVAKLTTSKLKPGTYKVTIINSVTGEKQVRNTTIVKRLVENTNVVKDYSTSPAYDVIAIGDNGKAVGAGVTVAIKVNGKTYKIKTNKNGHAIRTIGLIPGKYTITAKYHGCTVKNKVVVKQVIKSSNVKVKKSAKSLKLKTTLKYSNGKAIAGKKVTFKFKGKTYTAKTNKKGVASVTLNKKVIKTLKKGKKYTYKVKYILASVKKQVIVK